MNRTQEVTISLPNATITGSFALPLTRNVFGWVRETVAHHMDCSEDEVDEIETDEGDRITVRGQIVGHCELGFRKDEPAPLMQAAE